MSTEDRAPAPVGGVGERLLAELWRRGIGGAGPFVSAEAIAADQLEACHGDVEAAVKRLVGTHVRLAASSGLLTSLGGAATMVVTAPAGVTGLYLLGTRMVAAIAHVRGHDLTSPVTRTAVLLCLLGPDGTELAERTGIDLDNVSLLAGLRRLPPEVRDQLERRASYRLASRFGRRGALNLTKLIPLVAGPIGVGADAMSARTMATYADVTFPPPR